MAKFTGFDASLGAKGPISVRRATAKDFGGSGEGLQKTGAAIEKFGDQIAEANLRVSNRRDTIAVADAKENFETGLADELRRVQAEESLIDPRTLSNFRAEALKRRQDVLDNFTGTEDARARLSVKMTNIAGTQTRALAEMSNTAGIARVSQVMDKDFRLIIREAIESGDIQSAFDKLGLVAADATGALSDQVLRKKVAAQREILLVQIFDTKLKIDEDVEGARAVLKVKGIEKLLAPKTLLRMRLDIKKVDRANEKGAREAQQALIKYAIIKGVPVDQLTLADRNAINNFTPDHSPSEKLALIVKANTDADLPDLTDEVKQRILTGFAQEAENKTFTPAGARSITTDVGWKIVENSASDEEIRQFIAATTVITQTRTVLQPDGSLLTIGPGVLTQTSKNALDHMGVTATGELVTAMDVLGPNASSSSRDTGSASGVSGTSMLDPAGPPLPLEGTVFGASFYGTGFLSAVKSFAAGVPLVGETEFFRSEKVVKARQLLELMQNELVNVLRFGHRADKERQEIKEEISIRPQDLESPQRYRDRLSAIDESLAKREKAAFDLLHSRKIVGGDQKKELREFLNKVSTFREKLGVPTNYKSFDEARKAGLRPGAIVRVNGQYVTFSGQE